MNLSELSHLLQSPLTPSSAENLTYQDVSIDTRTLQPGNLFVAIKGENFDGHDFIQEAEKKGAVAVIVNHACETTPGSAVGWAKDPAAFAGDVPTMPALKVENTIHALGKLSSHHRDQFHIPVIGITGSCGKTTTRALTASILQQCGQTLFSESSFNNDIGMPLTLLRLQEKDQYAVIEMGTNHFGEMSYLTHIVKPTVAMIINAAAVHLEGFGSVAGVCKAKGEIFEGLTPDGTAILNADDAHFEDWKKMIGSRKLLTFSMTQPTDIYAKDISLTPEGKPVFTLVTPQGETQIHLPLLGRHNINNALAAAAVAYAVDAQLAAIKTGLEKTTAVKRRLNHHQLPNGVELIDDSYNASPLAVQAAIDILAQRPGEKILVLGDMRELGDHTDSAHEQIGEYARKAGIDFLYTYGTATALTSKAFGEKAQHFTDQAPLIASLKTNTRSGTSVLVKGSFSMKMGQVVQALLS